MKPHEPLADHMAIWPRPTHQEGFLLEEGEDGASVARCARCDAGPFKDRQSLRPELWWSWVELGGVLAKGGVWKIGVGK